MENTDTNDDNRITLYRYSANPSETKVRKNEYLTDDPSMSSDEAMDKLALPRDNSGKQLYVYPVNIPQDAVRPGKNSDNGRVRPTPHEKAPKEVFDSRPGGAMEYQVNPGREHEAIKGPPRPAVPPE